MGTKVNRDDVEEDQRVRDLLAGFAVFPAFAVFAVFTALTVFTDFTGFTVFTALAGVTASPPSPTSLEPSGQRIGDDARLLGLVRMPRTLPPGSRAPDDRRSAR